ncbi:MAG: hypothetical protein QOF78_2723 [Phycisphaerales bacterium]|jgi:hypothetical protein|nr:hypothetical protein [Phycisphaerales bacterium]
MPPRRWLEYDTPLGPPIRCGHSFYGIAAALIAVIAIAAVVTIERHLLPLSLLPLALPAATFASFGSLFACAAASLDQSSKHTFTFVGAAMTGSIPLAAWLASEPMVQLIKSLIPG